MKPDPHDVAAQSYAYWTKGSLYGAYSHIDACVLLAMEDGETSFRWKETDQSGAYINCVVGDHGQAYGAFQHRLARILEMAAPTPAGCGIDVRTCNHLQDLQATDWETTKGEYKIIRPALKAASTPQAKVAVMVHLFERSANQPRDIERRLHLFDYWDGHFKP